LPSTVPGVVGTASLAWFSFILLDLLVAIFSRASEGTKAKLTDQYAIGNSKAEAKKQK
jgi:hypothetical protein